LNDKSDTISKLLLDQEKDLRFHLAYLAYSEAWDKNNNDEIRKKLNGLIESLSNNEIDSKTFYYKLDRFRTKTEPRRYTPIKSQRKKAWRENEAKRTRFQRHK